MPRLAFPLLCALMLLGTACASREGVDAVAEATAQEEGGGTEAADTAEREEEETPPGAEEQDEAMPRLAVGDGAEGRVTLIDLVTGEPVEEFEITGAPYLAVASNGRHLFATQYDDDRVDVIDGGAWTVDHGDHQHHYIAEPALLDPIEGPAPAHVVAHDGTAAVFTDGTGVAHLVDEEALEDGELAMEELETGLPHHGVVVPTGDGLVASLPHPQAEGELPLGVAVHAIDGEVLAEFPECPELHGELSTGAGVAFACGDGVLLVRPDGADSTATKIAYPADAPAETRSWTLSGDEDSPVAFGGFGEGLGDTALLRIDLDASTAQPLPLPMGMSAFAYDVEQDAVLIVTTDGQLHQLDATTGAIRASTAVAQPFTFEGGFDTPLPGVAVGEDRAYASDPAAGTVTEVATNDGLRVTRTFQIEGAPARLALLGTEPDQ